MKRYVTIIKLILPIIAVFLSIAAYYGLNDSGKQKATEYPYYIFFILIVLGIYLIIAVAAVFLKTLRSRVVHNM